MNDTKNLLIVGLVALAAFLLGSTNRDGDAVAQGYPGGSSDSNGQMVAVTGTIGSGVSVLWAIDTQDRRLAVYQCKGGKTIELVAARNIEWDFKIDTLNDVSRRSPAELRKLFLRGTEKGAGEGDKSDSAGDPDGSGAGADGAPGGTEEGD